MKHDLSNCTFIIPLKIESKDRWRNARLVLNYLLDNFNTNIKILEAGSNEIPNILDVTQSNITYIHLNLLDGQAFHKTRYLNILSENIETDIVACYDIDVILPINTYKLAVDNLASKEFDIIYPYGVGMFQRKIHINDETSIFSEYNYIESALSIYGHCNFCDYNTYKNVGFENENFISYGPEDQEKLYRYSKLGLNIGRINDVVYHLEHSRGVDSNESNICYNSNMELFEKIQQMDIDTLKSYYKITKL